MNQEQAGLIMIALMTLALAGAGWGWWNRHKRYEPLARAMNWSVPAGEARYRAEGLYVATTEATKPLQRVAVKPLAYRSKVVVEVYPEGLVLRIRGSNPILIPVGAGISAGRATWTIDRVVEPDGLVMVGWKLGEHDVESYFRLVDSDSEDLILHIEQIGKAQR
jgi:hypothetical protein